MESYVKSCQCQVVGTTDNGNDAIRLAEETRPDLILMDVRLEGDKDGIDTMLLIGERWNIPCIYVTGDIAPLTLERAKKTNMIGLLVKPVSKEDLVRLMDC